MQPLEKINRALILAPCVGILLNLFNAEAATAHPLAHSLMSTLATLESSCTLERFDYLVQFNWVRTPHSLFFHYSQEPCMALEYWGYKPAVGSETRSPNTRLVIL
jgi:hypothetical protein